MIGDDIEVSVLSIMGEKVRIGIQAPRDIPVFRKEVYLEIQQENVAAGATRGPRSTTRSSGCPEHSRRGPPRPARAALAHHVVQRLEHRDVTMAAVERRARAGEKRSEPRRWARSAARTRLTADRLLLQASLGVRGRPDLLDELRLDIGQALSHAHGQDDLMTPATATQRPAWRAAAASRRNSSAWATLGWIVSGWA